MGDFLGSASIMTNDFIKAFNDVLEDKQLPKEVILEAIESAMASAYRRAVNASSAQEVVAKIDSETGDVTIFAEKEIVEDVQDERTETTLEDALQVDPEAEMGGMALVESTPANFGRVAAQTARQVIQQRIREAERAVQAEYFERQIGEIVSGTVQATAGRHGVTVGLDMKAEGTMPNNQKIPGERFRVHDRVRAVVLEVKDTPRGPQIILSRGHGSFLRRLLENEVPEIYHGVVEIRGISREPGRRAKVAVSAMQDGIDPVGACVGIRGVRIQNIVRELHNEKIDIIEWNPDPVAYISKAISPARVTGVYLSDRPDATRTATVVVQEDQLSLAIGRDGQNARLAAKLTGWRIDIKSLVEATADSLNKLQNDEELAEILPWAVEEAPAVEALLAKKTEGRSLAPEEYQQMSTFMDRVEKRTIEVQAEADQAEQERLVEARADIHPAAFDMMLSDTDLKDHVFNILFEAEYETIGDLMLALRLDPDQVFGLPGIGPKAIENITEVLSAIEFPEIKVEEVEKETAVEESDAEVAVETEDVEGDEETEDSEQVEGESDAAGEDAEEEEVPSMDEIFEVQPDMLPASEKEDDVDLEEIAKEKKKKKKKYVKYEYDDELGEVVAKKRRKRKTNEWDEEDW
jgi:N utilization substance protein A